MCGVFGAVGVKRPFSHLTLRSLRKRGPDEIGFWSDGVVQLGHTRLSIIGLDERGTEPMENETHVMVYNGEIYNFNDLKKQLILEGVPVAGVNDAEVLLYGWGQWGPKILTELVGFWAFIMYDKVQRKLYLVRDQLGIKPLYYWHDENGICIATMIKTILEVKDQRPSLDYEAMSEYVRYQFTFGDKTFLREIKKVLPGHMVTFDLTTGQLTTTCYEDILAPVQQPKRPLTSEWIAETKELLIQCVLESTISDTSFTTFCSGGLDSSLITRITNPELAYHCNYADGECNETIHAKQVVANTDIRLFVVNAQEESLNLVQKLTDIVQDFDELTIGSVILPLEDLLAQVKRRFKVILTGTGGDELFGGYLRYQLTLGQCYQDSYKGLFQKMGPLSTTVDRFEMTHRKGTTGFYKFYEDKVEQTFKNEFIICQKDSDDMEAMLRFDRRYFLAGLLNIDDKMCGRHSLESRPSFLHQKLVRHVRQLDSKAFIQDRTLKHILRQMAQGLLPESVIFRTDKMGFTTPIGTFVNRSSHLIREQILDSPFNHLYALQKMNFTAETKFSREVFGLLMFDLWLNQYAI
ncbi:MAG: asparagine synthase (glutamine-hydrolyzing) [Anaerolineae bacterium]|nr:asparagine synthase (glutamine-hydrolyzing) [Anaerolineae bacterium]